MTEMELVLLPDDSACNSYGQPEKRSLGPALYYSLFGSPHDELPLVEVPHHVEQAPTIWAVQDLEADIMPADLPKEGGIKLVPVIAEVIQYGRESVRPSPL